MCQGSLVRRVQEMGSAKAECAVRAAAQSKTSLHSNSTEMERMLHQLTCWVATWSACRLNKTRYSSTCTQDGWAAAGFEQATVSSTAGNLRHVCDKQTTP